MPGVGRGRSAGAAGQRDRYVLISCAKPTTQGDSGFPLETWEPLGYAWMSRLDIAGDERFGNDQEVAHATTQWVMPYQPDMDPELVDVPQKRRLTYGCRDYDILAATPRGWHRDIELLTLARTG